MTIRNLIISGLTLTAVAACATAATTNDKPKGVAAFADDARLGDKTDKICFNSSIDGFSDNRARTVVLERGVNDHYLVEVMGVCTTLRHAQSIAIDSSLSCVRNGDYLIVSDSAFSLKDSSGIGPDRCLIKDIYKWDEDAVEES